MNKVYETCDTTSDEQYFPLGIWPTLEEALAAFDTEDADDINDISGHREDSLDVEIREREFGLSEHGKTIKKMQWRKTYDEAIDEYVWYKVKESK